MSLWPAQSSLTVPAYFRWPPLHNKYSTGSRIVPEKKEKWTQTDDGKGLKFNSVEVSLVNTGQH